MAFQHPIRVISDLHLAHPGSLVKEVRQLEPLLEKTKQVVFNGDTIELRMSKVREKAWEALLELKNLCRNGGVSPLFINGNHDPDISGHNHCDLLGGRVFVTHGHALFPSIAPWGRDARRLRENREQALEELCAGRKPDLEATLEAARQACLRIPDGNGTIGRTKLQWLAFIASEMAHPQRPFEVLRAWATLPAIAAVFAERHQSAARFLVIGHTHFPGWWRCRGRIILNTGAYFPWFGRRVLDIWEDRLSLRKVEWDGSSFRPGKEVFQCLTGPEKLDLGQPRLESGV